MSGSPICVGRSSAGLHADSAVMPAATLATARAARAPARTNERFPPTGQSAVSTVPSSTGRYGGWPPMGPHFWRLRRSTIIFSTPAISAGSGTPAMACALGATPNTSAVAWAENLEREYHFSGTWIRV